MNVNQRMFDTFEITNKPLRLGVVLLVGKFPLVFVYMYLFFLLSWKVLDFVYSHSSLLWLWVCLTRELLE